MKLTFVKTTSLAKIPAYAHAGDSGMDVSSIENACVPAHGFKLIGTGLAAIIPQGYEIQVRPRSGLQCKNGVVGAWGTVDEGYRGEIRVALYNHTDAPYFVNAGDRIAQFVLAPVTRPEVCEGTIEDLNADSTERGAGGFGSSGR